MKQSRYRFPDIVHYCLTLEYKFPESPKEIRSNHLDNLLAIARNDDQKIGFSIMQCRELKHDNPVFLPEFVIIIQSKASDEQLALNNLYKHYDDLFWNAPDSATMRHYELMRQTVKRIIQDYRSLQGNLYLTNNRGKLLSKWTTGARCDEYEYPVVNRP